MESEYRAAWIAMSMVHELATLGRLCSDRCLSVLDDVRRKAAGRVRTQWGDGEREWPWPVRAFIMHGDAVEAVVAGQNVYAVGMAERLDWYTLPDVISRKILETIRYQGEDERAWNERTGGDK